MFVRDSCVVVAGPRPEYLSLGAVDVTAGVLLNFSSVFFFFFFVRGRKIILWSPGFEPGFPNVRNLRR